MYGNELRDAATYLAFTDELFGLFLSHSEKSIALDHVLN